MKAKVTGVSAWQETPISGTLDIEVPRYVDAAGRASVSRYTGVLNAAKTGWANSLKPSEDLWLIVQGPDDPQGVRGAFRETLVYANRTVVTEFSRVLRSSDLTGLIFDYNEPVFEPEDLNFGEVPLTMRAAAAAIEQQQADHARATQDHQQVVDNLAGIAQSTDALRTGLYADYQIVVAETAARLNQTLATEPRPLTSRPDNVLVFQPPFFKRGTADGQRALTVASGTGTIEAARLKVEANVVGGSPQGTLLNHPWSEGVCWFLVPHDDRNIVMQWPITASSGARYAIWSNGSNLEAGFWNVRVDQGIDGVTSRANLPIPNEDFWVEIMAGPTHPGSAFVVRVWGVSQSREEASVGAVGFDQGAPLLPEGPVSFGALGASAALRSLTFNDWSTELNPIRAKAVPHGRWFHRLEGSRPVLCTTTSGAGLRMVVSDTPGVAVTVVIPFGMSYRPIVAARWREFGTGDAFTAWTRTAVPSNNSPGDLLRIDPVSGLNPNKRYEVHLVAIVHENDQHFVYGCGLCVADLVVAQGGTCAPYVHPLARWLEADGDSITAGVAALPYPPAPDPPSVPANLISEQGYLHVAADLLGAVPVLNGFGGTGVLVSGSGGVPDARTNVFNYMNGRPRRDHRPPDVVLINHLTNDAGAVNRNPSIVISSAQVRAGYAELVQKRQEHSPGAAVVAMRPFNGSFWFEIQDVAKALRIPTIDTTGWLDPATDYTDGTHPTRDGGHLKGGTRLASALKDIFGAGYWS